jgi:hypothetical protein
MNSIHEEAMKLLDRLLAGERGNLPMHVGILLERSSDLRNNDEHYRQILPLELQGLALDSNTAQEMILRICEATARNPNAAFLSAISTVGSPTVTRLALKLLVAPPRVLTPDELGQVLGIIQAFLPSLPLTDASVPAKLEPEVIQVLRKLSDSPDFVIKRHATRILNLFGWSGTVDE